MSFQLFALTVLFRNQQVAGSSPAGGSILSITYLRTFSQSSHLLRVFVSKRGILQKSPESAGQRPISIINNLRKVVVTLL